jgi:hypothetical protein
MIFYPYVTSKKAHLVACLFSTKNIDPVFHSIRVESKISSISIHPLNIHAINSISIRSKYKYIHNTGEKNLISQTAELPLINYPAWMQFN